MLVFDGLMLMFSGLSRDVGFVGRRSRASWLTQNIILR